MDNPTRLQQLHFGIALIGMGLLSVLFVLAPGKVREEYRGRVAGVFKEIGSELLKEV